jgi:hypothetical protein
MKTQKELKEMLTWAEGKAEEYPTDEYYAAVVLTLRWVLRVY